MQLTQPRIEVSIACQRLGLWDGTRLIREWPVSTSRYGIGFQEGSLKTPLGGFTIEEKHGDGAPLRTIFKARKPVGLWQPGTAAGEDLVLTRILWLGGREIRNANTRDRYIYIHGTNNEDGIGRPGSHGCIRMQNADVVELYEQAPAGTPVWVQE